LLRAWAILGHNNEKILRASWSSSVFSLSFKNNNQSQALDDNAITAKSLGDGRLCHLKHLPVIEIYINH